MTTVIKLKRGTSTPTTSDIVSGEVAIDTSAQKFYINDNGTIKEIGGGGSSGGISLTSLSVGPDGTPSGDGSLSYNNSTGVFTYTPPDLSGYLTSVSSADVTQHQASLSITESQISDLQNYLTSESDTLDSVIGRGSTTTTTAVIPFYYANQSAFPNATTYHGAIAHSHSDGAMYFAHGGNWNKIANDSQLANSSNWDTAYGWGDHSTAGYQTTASLNSDIDSHLNQSNPTAGYVLSWNGSDYAWVAQTSSGGGTMSNLVEDTTPQLGGTLDANGNTIDMGTNTITDAKVGNWDTAYSWGDHSTQGYLTVETNDLSSAVTWANVPDVNITQSSVTQHQAALSITESQISDLQSYLTSETSHADVLVDGDFGSAGIMATNGSGTYSIVTDNSSNWNTAYSWGDHSSAGYQSAASLNSDIDSHLNQSNPTSGYVLSWNGSDYAWVAQSGGSSSSSLTVSEIDGSSTTSNEVTSVTALRFDNTTGFNVTDLGSGEVKISLGSSFKTLQVSGQSDLVASGEDTLELIAGTGISITTNTSSTPKSLTITATGSSVAQVLNNGDFSDNSSAVELTSTTADQTIDSFAIADYRTAKYLIQAVNGGNIHSTEVFLTHDDTNVFITEYASVYTNSDLFTVSAEISGTDLNVIATPINSNTTFDFVRTLIVARVLQDFTFEGDLQSLSGSAVDLESLSGDAVDLSEGEVFSLAGDLNSLTGTVDLQTDTGSEDLLAA